MLVQLIKICLYYYLFDNRLQSYNFFRNPTALKCNYFPAPSKKLVVSQNGNDKDADPDGSKLGGQSSVCKKNCALFLTNVCKKFGE